MSSIKNAFRILEVVTEHQDSGLTFQNILNRVDLPKSSTHRTLKELVSRNCLFYDEQTKRYRGSLRLSRLGAAVVQNIDLRGLTLPFIHQMSETTGHNCHMGLLDSRSGVYIHKIESKGTGISLYSQVGKSFPLYCTGLGKAMLAFLPKSEVTDILKGELKAYTEKTIVDPDKIIKELAKIRKQGYALDREEITRGLMCVAAPIFNNEGKVIAAVSNTFLCFIESERGIDKELEAVLHCAGQVNAALAGSSLQ
jgi:IclR family KDG regulon transcriptional repressor